jgi:hypothetical protein
MVVSDPDPAPPCSTDAQKLLVKIGMELEGVVEVRPDANYEYFFNVRECAEGAAAQQSDLRPELVPY